MDHHNRQGQELIVISAPLNGIFALNTATGLTLKDVDLRDFYIHARHKLDPSNSRDSSKCVWMSPSLAYELGASSE